MKLDFSKNAPTTADIWTTHIKSYMGGNVPLDQQKNITEQQGRIGMLEYPWCSSHTMNIISTNEVDKYLASQAESKAVYKSSTAKCTALWSKASRSPLVTEEVEKVHSRKLFVSSSTRWNSFYDAIKRISEIPMNELNTLCATVGVSCFEEKE
ncbi:uncharacterized protein V6R79_002372 [Siganus canaliculatus]